MPATLEKTVTIDRALARRASRKLHRYGVNLDDAFAGALSMIVSMRGIPSFVPRPAEDERDMEFSNVEDAISYLHAHV